MPTPKHAKRVVVAMSGGVDSSLAAALMTDQGYETIGVTMHLAGETSRCCSLSDVEDARSVAERLGIRFFVANYRDRFRKEVIESFADAYLAGRTPIPCVTCNTRFKFAYLLERARIFDAPRVATGHYARVSMDAATGLRQLHRAKDVDKDQSYFLFQLNQEQLAAIEFPLGELTKDQVRERAREFGLSTADKPESQEICFVPQGHYTRVVEEIRPDALPGEGEIVDLEGRVVGRHAGIHHYTVGQRRGLNVAGTERLYVIALDADKNRVMVGGLADLCATRARIEGVSWIAGSAPPAGTRATVQVRYRHQGAAATLEPGLDDTVELKFDEPVRAVAPGQAAVFYAGDTVLGGGWIARPDA
jgi:tRNA-specific 2-thiouridylase